MVMGIALSSEADVPGAESGVGTMALAGTELGLTPADGLPEPCGLHISVNGMAGHCSNPRPPLENYLNFL